MPNYGRPIKERYDVDPDTGCWVWNGANSGGGPGNLYPCINRDGHRRAHRWMYEREVGPIPEGHYVLHRCDNTLCVNPEHLFTGTQKANMDDMRTKGRDNPPVGETNGGGGKLTADDVRQIRFIRRTDQASFSDLATRFGVSDVMVRNIITGKSWAHVP